MSLVEKFRDFIKNNYLRLAVSLAMGVVLWLTADSYITADKTIEGVKVGFDTPENVIISRVNSSSNLDFRVDVVINGPRGVVEDLKADDLSIQLEIPADAVDPNEHGVQVYNRRIIKTDVKLKSNLPDVKVLRLVGNTDVRLTIEVTERRMVKVRPVLDWSELTEFEPEAVVECYPPTLWIQVSKRRWAESPIEYIPTMPVKVRANKKEKHDQSLQFQTRVSLDIDESRYRLVNMSYADVSISVSATVPEKFKYSIPITLTGIDPDRDKDKIFSVEPKVIELEVIMPRNLWTIWRTKHRDEAPVTAMIDIEKPPQISYPDRVVGQRRSLGKFRPKILVTSNYPGTMVDESPLNNIDNLPEVFSEPRREETVVKPFPHPVPVQILVGRPIPYTMTPRPREISVRLAGSPDMVRKMLENPDSDEISLYVMADEAEELKDKEPIKALGDSRTLHLHLHYNIPGYRGVRLMAREQDIDLAKQTVGVLYEKIKTHGGSSGTKAFKKVTAPVVPLGAAAVKLDIQPAEVIVGLEWKKEDDVSISSAPAGELLLAYVDLNAPPVDRKGVPAGANPISGNYPLRIAFLKPGISLREPLKTTVKITASERPVPIVTRPWPKKLPVEIIADTGPDFVVSVKSPNLAVRITGPASLVENAFNDPGSPPVALLAPVRLADFDNPDEKGRTKKIRILPVALKYGLSAVDESGAAPVVEVIVKRKKVAKPEIIEYRLDTPVSVLMPGSKFVAGSVSVEPTSLRIVLTGPKQTVENYRKRLESGKAAPPFTAVVLAPKLLLESESEKTGKAIPIVILFEPGIAAKLEKQLFVKWTFLPSARQAQPDEGKKPNPEKQPKNKKPAQKPVKPEGGKTGNNGHDEQPKNDGK